MSKKTFFEIINSKDCYADLVLLYKFYEKNQSIILSALNILSNEGNNKDIRALYEKLANNTTPKYVLEYNSTILNDIDKKNNNIIGMNLHTVVITFVQTVADQNNKNDITDFFNGIKKGFAPDKLDSLDQRRFDIYIQNKSNDIEYKCRGDKFSGEAKDIFIIVSNQWGSLENGKGAFDKFLKQVKENYKNFIITELTDYIEKNQQ